MQTISIKHLPATATKPARVKATASGGGGSVIVSNNAADDSILLAVRQLCQKLDWHGMIAGGHTKDGMVFVFLDEKWVVKV